jgi:hypothetical protein
MKSCSRIRQQTFATVNALNEDENKCCIWDFGKLRIRRVLENLQRPNQVRFFHFYLRINFIY